MWEQFLNALSHNRHFQDSVAARTHLRRHLNQRFHKIRKVCRINVGYLRVHTPEYLFKKPLHVISSEGRLQRD